MQPGSKVLELKKSERDSTNKSMYYNTYWHLCEILNVDYYYQACEARDKLESSHTADVEVCANALSKEIEVMIGNIKSDKNKK